jgi:hypothetical protein
MGDRDPRVIEGAARDNRNAWGSVRIVPHPAQYTKQARRRVWLRLCAATRDPSTWALIHQHRQVWAVYMRRCG